MLLRAVGIVFEGRWGVDGVIGVEGRWYCGWRPVEVRLLPPCEGRVVKGVISYGTQD